MTDRDSPADRLLVGEAYRHRLTTQFYGPKPQIDGVQIVDLRVFSDEGGDFCEIARFLGGGGLQTLPDFHPAQISYSLMEPGVIKAWHLHERQDDLWFVPPGNRLLVGLLDVRGASPTFRNSMRLTMGAGKANLIYIPRGVAHGVANLTQCEASIIYFADNAFDAEKPDEFRLDHDVLGPEFWTIPAG